MKHIRNKPLLLLATTALLLLASCTKELPTEAIGEGSYLSLSIDGQQSPSVEASPAAASIARQGASTRAAVQESAVNNLWILQFQMTAGSTTEGKLVKKIYIDTAADLADLKKIKYSPAAGSNMALYLVANVGSSLFSSYAEGTNGTSLANIKATTVSVTTTTGYNFPAANSADLPMVGLSATDLKLPISTPVPVTLTRTVAKVTLTVKNLLEAGYPKLTITSTQLKNVPQIYSTQVVNAANGFTGTSYYPPTSTTNYYRDYTAVQGNIPAAGTTWTYYLAPNARGTSTNTDDRLKSDATAPSGQGPRCTYVEILGKAKTTATSPDAEDVDVRYRLYLGGNNTNDFNLYSNTAYKVGIELTGLFSADARLTITTDKFDIVKGDSDGDHKDDIIDWRPITIGDFRDNGVVFWVDDNDLTKYKVVSVTEWSGKKWAEKKTYVIGVNARSDTDGKGNTAAIKDYFDYNTNTVGTNFTVAFPAAAECYNYQGKDNSDPKGTWYLPAKSELQYLYCAYNGAKATTWDKTATGAPAENTTAHDVFDGYLKNAGGIPISYGYPFWSSTEFFGLNMSGYAYYLGSDNGYTYPTGIVSPFRVRCIRNIAPPPAVGDYYYTDGTYSTSIESGKTVNGIVYYVDPTNPSKFKVLALDESGSLSWSPSAYVVEGARSDIDGKGNSAAIKAKYDANYTSSAFSAAFPAAAHCYNYKGHTGTDAPGTWHLPAKHELQYLYCAFNGASPTTWKDGIQSTTPAPNATEKANWNAQLTAVSGTNLASRYYWASTESSAPAYAWLVRISDGATPIDSKFWNSNGTYFVRCVRDI